MDAIKDSSLLALTIKACEFNRSKQEKYKNREITKCSKKETKNIISSSMREEKFGNHILVQWVKRRNIRKTRKLVSSMKERKKN